MPSFTAPGRDLIREHAPATHRLTMMLSSQELRFLNLEVAAGQFDGLSAAARHYLRAGLKAEGVLEEALALP